jgi:hypothetical protein
MSAAILSSARVDEMLRPLDERRRDRRSVRPLPPLREPVSQEAARSCRERHHLTLVGQLERAGCTDRYKEIDAARTVRS